MIRRLRMAKISDAITYISYGLDLRQVLSLQITVYLEAVSYHTTSSKSSCASCYTHPS